VQVDAGGGEAQGVPDPPPQKKCCLTTLGFTFETDTELNPKPDNAFNRYVGPS
jgi:hypothetical protein